MSISNVNSATKVQGSKVNKTQTASNSVDVKGAKGLAASARETLTTNSGREMGSLLGADFEKQAGFAAIQGVMANFNQPLSRSTQLLNAMGERSKLPETAAA